MRASPAPSSWRRHGRPSAYRDAPTLWRARSGYHQKFLMRRGLPLRFRKPARSARASTSIAAVSAFGRSERSTRVSGARHWALDCGIVQPGEGKKSRAVGRSWSMLAKIVLSTATTRGLAPKPRFSAGTRARSSIPYNIRRHAFPKYLSALDGLSQARRSNRENSWLRLSCTERSQFRVWSVVGELAYQLLDSQRSGS